MPERHQPRIAEPAARGPAGAVRARSGMRAALLGALLLASCAALPPQPNQAYGPPSYDRSTRTLYIQGQAYDVPESINTFDLRRASMVLVDWEQQGDRRVVQRYSVTEYRDMFGLR